LQLVKKFPAFHGTRKFITALTSVRHLSLSWASPIQSIYPHRTSWRSFIILSTHLRLGLPSGLLLSGFPTKTLVTVYKKWEAFFLECRRIYSDLWSKPSIKCEMKFETTSFLNVFHMLFVHLSDYSLCYRTLFLVMRYHFILQVSLKKIAVLRLH